jgi:hypothetical protein
MTTKRSPAGAPGADVFARTVPLMIEKHYFGESRSANMAPVQLTEGGKAIPTEDQARTKAFLSLRKKLLDSEELRRIRYRDGAFKDFLKGSATPFRPGLWLVPVKLTELVAAEARKWEEEREALVEKACDVYPSLVAAMRKPLGVMYNQLDYPSVDVFRSKYWVEWRFINFGVAEVLREVRADIFRREEEKLVRQASEARVLIEQHLRSGLLEVTKHLHDLLAPKASGRRVGLRENCLDRLNEFLGTVEARDVTGDKELGKVVAKLRKFTATMDVQAIRDDDELRDRATEEMEAVATTLEALVVEGPARGIRVRAEEMAS